MIPKHSQTILTILASCALTIAGSAQSPTAIPKLDLNRMTGTWLELAHLPDKKEKLCVSDATILFALADKPGRLQIVATCLYKDSTSNVYNKDAKRADKSGDGKLKIAGLLPFFLFAQKSWVLATGPDYAWLLLGSPNHKTLRILSKTQTLPPATLAAIESTATAEGYPIAKLIRIPQTP